MQIPDPTTLADLEALAVRVATECGRLITDERPTALGVHHTKSSAVDVVTIMDQRSEELASRLLHEARPQDGAYGEEGLATTGTSGVSWVVDPIDGTVNYLYELPAYAVSVAAVVGDVAVEGAWRPVAGAVVNPATGEVFSAHLGGGAHKRVGDDVVALQASPADTLAMSLVGTGFGYDADVRRAQGAVVAALLPQCRDIRRLGSAALDLCHVADGQMDAYYERGLHPWDMAAGWLVAAEAGVEVRGQGGGPAGATLTMAGAASVLDELTPLIGG